MSGPAKLNANGALIAVRLSPKASLERIDGLVQHSPGEWRLKARVRAAPDKGKANAALLRLLAGAWDLPVSRLEVSAGTTARNKTVRIRAATESEFQRLTQWFETLDRSDQT